MPNVARSRSSLNTNRRTRTTSVCCGSSAIHAGVEHSVLRISKLWSTDRKIRSTTATRLRIVTLPSNPQDTAGSHQIQPQDQEKRRVKRALPTQPTFLRRRTSRGRPRRRQREGKTRKGDSSTRCYDPGQLLLHAVRRPLFVPPGVRENWNRRGKRSEVRNVERGVDALSAYVHRRLLTRRSLNCGSLLR